MVSLEELRKLRNKYAKEHHKKAYYKLGRPTQKAVDHQVVLQLDRKQIAILEKQDKRILGKRNL